MPGAGRPSGSRDKASGGRKSRADADRERIRARAQASARRTPGIAASLWLIDSLQLLVEANHGALLYPGWSNTSSYKPTKEGFGTVPLHSQELGKAIESPR